MNPQMIIAAVIAAIGFGGGWTIQSWRYGAKEAKNAEQKLVHIQQSAAADIRRLDNVVSAQNQASVRSVGLRIALDGALNELDRLRVIVSNTVPSTCDATSTGTHRATATSELFLECAAAFTELGGKAARHASDLKTLMDSWPK